MVLPVLLLSPDVVIATHYGATDDEDDLMTTRFEYGGLVSLGTKKVIHWALWGWVTHVMGYIATHKKWKI